MQRRRCQKFGICVRQPRGFHTGLYTYLFMLDCNDCGSCLYAVWISRQQVLEQLLCLVKVAQIVLRQGGLRDDPLAPGKLLC